MTTGQLNIYCDGGSRGNPGLAASAFVIFDETGGVIVKSGKFLGSATNNQAEYQAVLFALQFVEKNNLNPSRINFILDSELVVRQMTGIYRIKNQGLQTRAMAIRAIEKKLGIPVSYRHVPRSENKVADSMVNRALDERHDIEEGNF